MFLENIPVSLLQNKGYKDIVVVRLMNDFIGNRSLNKYQDCNIKIITPSEHLGGSLNLDRDNIEKNVDLGYLDTMKVYNRYDGNRYYFNVDFKYDEDYCFNKFRNMNKESIKNILDLLNIKRDVNLRTLLEVAIPKVGDLLELEKDFTYKDLYYSIYEKKLEDNNINRVKLYDFNKVVEVVNTNINSNVNLGNNIEIKNIIPIKNNRFTKLLTNIIINDIKAQN
jgi:NTE family protein